MRHPMCCLESERVLGTGFTHSCVARLDELGSIIASLRHARICVVVSCENNFQLTSRRRCRVPDWRRNLNKLGYIASERLHVAVGVDERLHRFREVSGVPAIEAAAAELNRRLAARGVPLPQTSCCVLR